MIIKALRFCIYTVTALVLVSGCTDLQLAGSISETTNGGVVGAIVDQGGAPAGQTQVVLLPADYDPVKHSAIVSADTTDSLGNYTFSKIAAGDYVIQATHIYKRTSVLIWGIHFDGRIDTVAPDTLRRPGSVKVMLPAGADAVKGYVYIPGSVVFAFLNNRSDFVTLDSVPAGMVAEVSYASITTSAVSVIRYGALVTSQDTTTIWNPAWKYARNFFLNTSETGANVTGTVAGFPVLVRLNSGNFDFSHAQTAGGDIRFTKADGTPLPYEIERYDAGLHRAEIWVKADTVYGNDSSHFITMYWGNPAASSESNGSAVFDTGNGFQGAWHLGESDSLAADATGNRYDGTGYSTASIKGIIGKARHFNGASSYIQMKGTAPQSRLNFPMNGRYTISAWVYHDTLADSVTYLIAGKGELQYFMKTFGLAQSTPQHEHQWEFTEYHGNDTWQAATLTPAVAKTWTHLVGIRDGSNQFLYVNGVLVMAGYRTFGTGQTAVPRDTSDDFSIGAFLRPVIAWDQGYAFFSGAIDEVGVSSIPRSADWIKLSYMNQKEEDALVKW